MRSSKHGYWMWTSLPDDEAALNALARLSPWTRDFANPPMSLKTMRKAAIEQQEVYHATATPVRGGEGNVEIVGFVWCRPMKPSHMPYSTVYYMGVHPEHQRQGVATLMLRYALTQAKHNTIELVCEDANPAAAFYKAARGQPIRTGVVGKDNRPYTRWRFQ